jgi:hypothetical protein
MTRAVLSAAIDSEWRLVSNERPCPVCGASEACSIHTADDFACCAREPSDWKLTNGAWLHRVPSRTAIAPIAQAGLGMPAAAIELAANGNAIRP